MNWLAHLHLSGTCPATRIGNLLPDLVPLPVLQDLPAIFSPGIQMHRAIDAFTDSHAIFRQSRGRVGGELARYSPILIDVFYDHFLARNWVSYSAISLARFVDEFHASIKSYRGVLPEVVMQKLERIRDDGFLYSYYETEGIAVALDRISLRMKRPVNLRAGVDGLLAQYDLFAEDFRAFYPQLRAHLGQ